MTDQITSDTEPTDLATALIELRHARQEVARLRPFVDMVDQAQRDAEAVELASPAPLLALAAREKTIRDHTLTLHLMGEQLSDIESWFWMHLADVREAARKKIGGSLPDDVTASAQIDGEQPARTTVNNPPTSSGTPADTLRERIADAARTVHLCLGPIAIGMARGGDPIILSPSEANQVADAAIAALAQHLDIGDAEAAVARVRKVIAERRAEVAEREVDGMLEFGTPGASWCDAVTVTCDRIDDALRIFPEPGWIPCNDDQTQEQP